MNRTIKTGLAIVALFGAVVGAQAQGPAGAGPGHSGVRDRAKMFSPEAVKKADAQLENLRSLKHWQVIIETVESISGGRTIDQAVLENAKELQVHGLYVLIDKKDKKLRVEPSNTARKVFSKEADRAIIDAFTTAFKAKDFDKGLFDAVALIRKEAGLSAEMKAAAPPPSPPSTTTSTTTEKVITPPATNTTPTPPARAAVPPAQAAPPEPAAAGGSIMPIVIGGVVVLFLLWLVSRIFRRAPAAQQMPVQGMAGGGGPGYAPRPNPNPGYPQPGYPPQPGYGPPQPGYGYGPPPQQGGGMGGFMSGALGGLGGAIAGNILYDKFGRPHEAPSHDQGNVMPTHHDPSGGGGGGAAWPPPDAPASAPAETYDPDAGAGGGWSEDSNAAAPDTGGTGGDWGSQPDDSGSTGGDWGGGGDGGGDTGGDWGGGGGDGGGDAGGDWGGGDSGSEPQGGDW